MKQHFIILPPLGFCHHTHLNNNPCSIHHYRREGPKHDVTMTIRRDATTAFSALFAEKADGSEDKYNGSDNQQQEDPSMFFELMSPITTVKPDQMSASAQAYLGDVVFELFVRSRYVWPSRRMSNLQNKVVSVVRAETQSILLQKFIKSFPLTSIEQGVLARGRNAVLTAKKKGKSANNSGGASAYQDSTAFEALIGYTYINDKKRFNEMMTWIQTELDAMDGLPPGS